MLKFLNILGYFSLFSLGYYAANFLLTFDLFLQVMNGIFVVLLLIINFIFFRKKKYPGIRCCIIIILMFVFSILSYNVYGFIRGNLFKNTIIEITDQNKNTILTSENLSSYDAKYVPDKIVIDMISKGSGQKGYIKIKGSDEYKEITYSSTISSFGTHPNHYTIIYNSNRYYIR